MAPLTLILILLGAAAALNLAAVRLRIPHPVLLVVGGLVLALVPALPRARLDPQVVFLIFIPPLVYRAAIETSWRDFRVHLRSILLLAVGLVLVTIVAVAFVAHDLVPAFSWPAAFLLGAIVAPSDPVAATAVMRRLETPRNIDTVLAGEGLVNDATALVAYRMGVEAMTYGTFTLESALVRLVLAAAGGIAIGLAAGVSIAWLRRHVTQAPEVENTISLLTPFVAYIPADRLGVSGVLAVLTVGLYLGREGPRIVAPETRVQGAGMWDMTTFVLEGLIFILVGLDLPLVTKDLPSGALMRLAKDGALLSLAAIAVRMLWIFPGTYLPRKLDEWRGHAPEYPPWRHVLFVGWAGMRGADSLVIALALPLTISAGRPFPSRSEIIFLTFIVILITLVAQGLTLEPLIRWLDVVEDGDEEKEEVVARLRTAQAGIAKLDEVIAHRPEFAAAARDLRARHIHRVHRYQRRRRGHRHGQDEARATAASRVRADMIAAERRELVNLRDSGVIADEVMRRVQRDLDLEQMLVGASDQALEQAE